MIQFGGNHKSKHKTIRGTKNQKRPSASYYYKVLGKSVGYKTSYRPRKGGKMIKYTLKLRKNGTPYWKAITKIPRKTLKNKRTIKIKSGGRTSLIKKTRSDTNTR